VWALSNLQVRNKRSKKILAMKVISKRLLRRKAGYIENVQAERNILTKVRHPFVVSMHCSFQTKEKLFIIMDFLAGGELFLRLGREGIFMEKTAAFYLAEIILALTICIIMSCIGTAGEYSVNRTVCDRLWPRQDFSEEELSDRKRRLEGLNCLGRWVHGKNDCSQGYACGITGVLVALPSKCWVNRPFDQEWNQGFYEINHV
jgi:hypothetical protein